MSQTVGPQRTSLFGFDPSSTHQHSASRLRRLFFSCRQGHVFAYPLETSPANRIFSNSTYSQMIFPWSSVANTVICGIVEATAGDEHQIFAASASPPKCPCPFKGAPSFTDQSEQRIFHVFHVSVMDQNWGANVPAIICHL